MTKISELWGSRRISRSVQVISKYWDNYANENSAKGSVLEQAGQQLSQQLVQKQGWLPKAGHHAFKEHELRWKMAKE